MQALALLLPPRQQEPTGHSAQTPPEEKYPTEQEDDCALAIWKELPSKQSTANFNKQHFEKVGEELSGRAKLTKTRRGRSH